MKRKFKKALSALIATFFMLSVLPVSAFAAGDSPELQSAEVIENGAAVELTFNKGMTAPESGSAGFAIMFSVTDKQVTAAQLDGTDNAKIRLTLATTVKGGEDIWLRYTPGTVSATDDGVLEGINYYAFANTLPHPALDSSAPIDGTLNIHYSHTFALSGGQEPYTFSSGSGLPQGLTLDSATGVLSGTPAATGTFSFGIDVTDSNFAIDSRAFSITIAGGENNVCEIGSTQYPSFGDALTAVTNGQTIRLLQNINYNSDIAVNGKNITFDVGSFTLNVTSSSGIGLYVSNGGTVSLSYTTGKFNVTGTTSGVSADGAGSALTVTNATATVNTGAYASNGGKITVLDSVIGVTSGAEAHSGCQIDVTNNVTATGTDINSIAASAVASPSGSATIHIGGNATGYRKGVNAESNSQYTGSVTVVGNVTTTSPGTQFQEDGVCVVVRLAGQVTIDGTINGVKYIQADGVLITAANLVPSTTKPGYNEFKNSYDSTVWIKASPVNVCQIGGTQYATLDDALAAVTDGQTITLLTSINYYQGISITDGRNIIFNLNGFNLNIASSGGDGLTVTNGSVCYTGAGAFNVSGASFGLNVNGSNASATVTNATATFPVSYGAYASNGGSITIDNNVEGGYAGAYAGANSNIVVSGDAVGNGADSYGAYATGNGSIVTVQGNAIGTGASSFGAGAYQGGSVIIEGNAQGVLYGVNAVGVVNSVKSSVAVLKNVTASDELNGIGALAAAGGKITIDGTITAKNYIKIYLTLMFESPVSRTLPTTKEGYHTYSDGFSVVWVWDTSAPPTGDARWNYRSPLPTPNIMENVKYIGGKYMALGYNGTLITSTDGASWQKVEVGTDTDRLTGIAYGGNKYVVVGTACDYAARIYTSDDGLSWHETAAIPDHWLYDVVYGDNEFVAVGQSGKILISGDGETWETKTVSPMNYTLLSVTYADGKYVAAGMGATTAYPKGGIMTSTDGEAWTVTHTNSSYTLWDVTYGEGFFAAVGGSSNQYGGYYICTSPDGTNWTQRSVSGGTTSARIYSVDYDGSRFIAVGATNGTWPYTAYVAVSENGISWTYQGDSAIPAFRAVASNASGSRYVAVGGTGNIFTSDNGGGSWTYRTLGTTRALRDAAWNGSDLFVTVGIEGTIQTSPDGETWTIQNSGTTYDLNKVDYLNGQFIAVGKNGTILTSENGTAWTSRTSGTTRELKGIAYGSGRYIVVGGESSISIVLTSTDGITWNTVTDTDFYSRSFVAVAYGNGNFLALMAYGQAFASSDGIDWMHVTDIPGSGRYPTDMIYAGGKFAAVGGYGEIYLSSDNGASWTVVDSDLDSYSRAITYGGGNFVAVGVRGKIIASADGGTTWFVQPSGLSPNPYFSLSDDAELYGIAAGDDSFMVVGYNGVILQSESFSVSTDPDAHDVAIAKAGLYFGDFSGPGANNAGGIVMGMNLITSGDNGTAISWTSSKPQYIAANGDVTRPSFGTGSQVVYLNATISKGSATDAKTFIVVVRENSNPDIQAVADARAALTFDVIKGSNTAANNIVSNLDLITAGTNGTTISWSSSKPAYIAADGTVNRPAQGANDEAVTLIATITKGSASDTKTFNLTVKAQTSLDAQDVAAAKEALTFNVIKGSNTVENNIVSNLDLITAGDNGTAISWVSSKPAYITVDGTVTRPAQGANDETVTLTATITKGDASDTRVITLTVKAEETLTDAAAVAVDKASLTWNSIKGTNTSVGSITAALNLMTVGANGTNIAWSVSPDEGWINPTTGAVTRPTYSQGDKTVTLTATITKGNASDTMVFNLTVKAQTGRGGGGGTEKPAAQVFDSNGNIIKTVTINLDNSTGVVAIEVNSVSLNSAFDKSTTDDKGVKTVVVDIPKIDGAKAYEPALPASFLTAGDASKAVEIKTGIAAVTVPGNMLTVADAAGAQNVSLTIATGDKSKLYAAVRDQIGERPVIELNLKIDGKQTAWSNESAPVTVTIPYTPTAEELKDPENITVWYIDGSGNAVSVPDGRYDPATGQVIFSTTHFSRYAIVFVQKAGTLGVTRLAGLTRVDTALTVAKATYPGKVDHAVLATADNYPDALAGSVLAYKLNAPILLVGNAEADQEKVLDYFKSNLGPEGRVYILGGTAAVGSSMEGKITASGFSHLTRIAGVDRYETSVKIAEQLEVKAGTPVVLVSGENYPDALSVSSIAAQKQLPVLLVQKDGIGDAVRQKIAAIKPSKVYIIGLQGVISADVENQVAQITGLATTDIVRIGGADRYATSLAVAQYFNLSSQTVCIATGNNFPDALAGSVYAAKHKAPIILANGSLSEQAMNYLKSRKPTGTAIFGGEAVVGKDIELQLGQLVGQ